MKCHFVARRKICDHIKTANSSASGGIVTSDSLSNLVANIGTNRDKRTHNRFGFQFVTPYELEAAYQSNWLARRIVDKPNEDALREWRKFSGKTRARSLPRSAGWVFSRSTWMRAAGLTCTAARPC